MGEAMDMRQRSAAGMAYTTLVSVGWWGLDDDVY